MNNRSFLFFVSILLLGLGNMSCNRKSQNSCCAGHGADAKVDIVLKDYGPEPLVLNIEAATLSNENFRTALWTGTLMQLTVMSIPVGGEIGLEMHNDVDQFLRIEEGQGKVLMGDAEDALTFVKEVEADFAVFIPVGKWHNVVNTGDKPLKLYSIYSPVEHPHGTVHKTFEEAEAAEHQH